MGKYQHVTPKGSQWQVKAGGSKRATAITSTQSEAIGIAKNIAKNQQTEVVIHGRNGQIRRKHSYGNDPYPPKG